MTEHQTAGRPAPARPPRPRTPLTQDQLEELGQRFTAALPLSLRFVRLAERGARQHADREDRRGVFLARLWQSWVCKAEQGLRPEGMVLSIAFWAAKSSLSRREFASDHASSDPLSRRRAAGQSRNRFAWHHLEEARPDRGGECDYKRPIPTRFADVAVDRRGSNPLDRALIREAIESVLARHGENVRAIVLHLSAGGKTGEVAQAVGVTEGRVSQVRQLMRREIRQLWIA